MSPERKADFRFTAGETPRRWRSAEHVFIDESGLTFVTSGVEAPGDANGGSRYRSHGPPLSPGPAARPWQARGRGGRGHPPRPSRLLRAVRHLPDPVRAALDDRQRAAVRGRDRIVLRAAQVGGRRAVLPWGPGDVRHAVHAGLAGGPAPLPADPSDAHVHTRELSGRVLPSQRYSRGPGQLHLRAYLHGRRHSDPTGQGHSVQRDQFRLRAPGGPARPGTIPRSTTSSRTTGCS